MLPPKTPPASWQNWSGSLRFLPGETVAPENEETLVALVRRNAEAGRTLRVVGAGHSSTPLVATNETLVSLEQFSSVGPCDAETGEATVQAGATVCEAGQALLEEGLAMHNQGDVNTQTVAGAFSTGTHGTGKSLPILSSQLIGGRMVTAEGEVLEFLEHDEDFLNAARVSLGVLGIFTTLKLRLKPAFRLERREYCTHIESCLTHLDELVNTNRNFDFYWYPRSDRAKVRTWNEPGEGRAELPYAVLVHENVGWSYEMLSKERHLKYEEMEYAVPAQNGPDCFDEVRKRVKERWRQWVGWRVLYRTGAADNTYLSHAYGHDVVTISLHQNASLPYADYFRDIEPIFLNWGGRPHWAKKHTLKARDLRPLYPKWDAFQAWRGQLDPKGRFLSPYLRELLGEEHDG